MKLSLVVFVALIGICHTVPAHEKVNLEESDEQDAQLDSEPRNDITEENDDPSMYYPIIDNV